ncbi:MAG: TonB C-terminal domain-containing protein [Deltaproteobacteria bacterium]|jgi:TonB family protein|nr:TonB C-terminal domain-containing protein [Deltaproteobacteria bacterium]
MSLARASERPGPAFFGPDGLRLGLFLVAAAWIHLGGFLLWERVGPVLYAPEPISEDLLGIPLEITLELSTPAIPDPAELAPPPVPSAALTSPASSPPDPALQAQLQAQAEALAQVQALTRDMIADAAEMPLEAPPPDPLPDPAAEVPPPDSMASAAAAMAPPPEELSFPLSRETPLLPGDTPGPEGDSERSDGTVRLEETAPFLKSYDASVRSRVAMHWLLPPEARSNFQPGRFTASMTLAPDGSILVIMVEESSGSSTLDHAAMEALKAAAPFEPFPKSMADMDRMTFRIHFDYRAVVRRSLPDQRR